jgi:tRNA nucleotidyltransferase (CCA-adding enzyme)
MLIRSGILSEYAKFLGHLQSENLLEAYALKPLITGTELAKALDTKPGPWMKAALEEVVAWQLLNPTATDSAAAIEQVKKNQGELPSRLATHFLRLTVRPLFAPPQTSPNKPIGGHHSAVTDKGRRDISADTLSHRFNQINILSDEEEERAKPWKYGKDGEHGMALLRWVLRFCQPDGKIQSRWLLPGGEEETAMLSDSDRQSNQSKAAFIQRNWPLLIPPILTILDDPDPVTKAVGCDLTRQLLIATPPSHLQRTGLAQVFENALLPCLTYLPTLTPADDSAVLLSAVHPALLALAQVRYPPSSPLKPLIPAPDAPEFTPSGLPAILLNDDPNHQPFVNALDTVLRRGIFAPFAHTGTEHPAVAIALLRALQPLVLGLGVETVRHLQNLVPLLVGVLADPFVIVKIDLPIAALAALVDLVRTAWPRIERWRWEIVKGTVSVWTRAMEEEEEKGTVHGAESLRQLCRELVGALTAVVEAAEEESEPTWRQQVKALVTADERLESLFGEVLVVPKS